MDIEYSEIDRDSTPLGTLVLRRYHAESGETGYQIELEGSFLMASHGCHSERALATAAHDRLGCPARDLSVLVGGLGAGHTLRAALDLSGVSRVVVAEIGARVVDWNRRYFAAVNGAAVDDPRVEVRIADLAEVLAASPGIFDLLLLDVDNGPGWLAAQHNQRLYECTGVGTCRSALRPGGVLAVWSPAPNPTFRATLEQVFAHVSEEQSRGEDEPASTIYLACLHDPSPPAGSVSSDTG
jgi:spermidine synthase